jgi:hypothetical protein
MNRFKNFILGAALLGGLGATATASDTILAQINDPGMVQLVDELSEGVTVFDYIGLEVSAHHCSGHIETITLGTGYIPGYPASYAPPELHTACAVGTNWSVHVFNTGTRLGFCFRGLESTEICGFEIHALNSARMVFDRTNPAPGSLGSGNGLDARIEAYGYTFYGSGIIGYPGNADYYMYYVNEVSVMGRPPMADTYGKMYIEMIGGPHDTGDVVSFTVDMDYAADRPSERDPDPQDSSTSDDDDDGGSGDGGSGDGGSINDWLRELFNRGGRSRALPR